MTPPRQPVHSDLSHITPMYEGDHSVRVPGGTTDKEALIQMLTNRIAEHQSRIETLEARCLAHRNRLDMMANQPRSRNKRVISYLGELALYGVLLLVILWLSKHV